MFNDTFGSDRINFISACMCSAILTLAYFHYGLAEVSWIFLLFVVLAFCRLLTLLIRCLGGLRVNDFQIIRSSPDSREAFKLWVVVLAIASPSFMSSFIPTETQHGEQELSELFSAQAEIAEVEMKNAIAGLLEKIEAQLSCNGFGFPCWDLNANGRCDAGEDANNDSFCSCLDCLE